MERVNFTAGEEEEETGLLIQEAAWHQLSGMHTATKELGISLALLLSTYP